MAQSHRIQFIDSARGVAMLFVLLSHFGFTFFPDQSARPPTLMRVIGMVASPSFVLINGILIGYLCRVRSYSDYRRLRTIFIDRALFLLTVGHLLLLGSHAPAYTVRFFSITDTIAVCLLISPFLADQLSARQRVAVGVATYIGSGIALAWWHPHAELSSILEESAVGSLSPVVYYHYAFPILPWFSLNCMGSALGDVVGRRHMRGDHAGSEAILARLAASAITTALMLNACYLALKHWHILESHLAFLRELVTPLQKSPPGPGYLLWYGGLGLFMICLCAFLESSGVAKRLLRWTARIGEASLFVFVFQFYVYLVGFLPFNTRIPRPDLWPVYFVGSCAVVITAALMWQRHNCNRLLTVGYRQLRERTDAEKLVISGSPYARRT